MNIKTFSIGGIHPEENKLTHDAVTQVAALPKQAIFPPKLEVSFLPPFSHLLAEQLLRLIQLLMQRAIASLLSISR